MMMHEFTFPAFAAPTDILQHVAATLVCDLCDQGDLIGWRLREMAIQIFGRDPTAIGDREILI